MRIAVCVSGAFNTGNPKGDLVRNNAIQKAKFPDADFYYATWEKYKPEFEKLFPNEKCEYFLEPEVLYHPYEIQPEDHISEFYHQTVTFMKQNNGQRMEWSSHHTKQLIIHDLLIGAVEKEYDVIVRTRFDGFIHKSANFLPYLEDTYKNHRANCFGATKQKEFDKLVEVNPHRNPKQGSWRDRLIDQLIIYNADAWDREKVKTLNDSKLLHAAEYGWWQIISLPDGSNHRNHSGWVNHDKNVLDKFLLEGL